MPFFGQSQLQKHTPEKIKLTDLYRHDMKKKFDLSTTDKLNMKKALKAVGYDSFSVNKMMTREITVREAKEVAAKLSGSGLKGFSKDGVRSLASYVKKEAVKSKNLAGRRRELMLEKMEEDNIKSNTKGSKLPTTKGKGGGSGVKLGF